MAEIINKSFLKRIEDFELHHKIFVFVGITILTIMFIRVGVLFTNPNPVLLNFEFHHFDYGLLILMVTVLLMLFWPKHNALYLISSAISFGMILDELWLIRGNVDDSTINQLSTYYSTFPSVLILVLSVVILILLINHFRKK